MSKVKLRYEDMPDSPIRVTKVAGYQKCGWEIGGDRCQFPGTMTTDTTGSGPWYCSVHFQCPDPIFGSSAVNASKDYVHETAKKLQEELVARDAKEFCENLGLTDVEKMREWLRTNSPLTASKKNVDWARKIMARVSSGEFMPSIAIEKAKMALGIKDEIS